MLEAAPVSSFITSIPPKPMMESCSPVLPNGRRAMGLGGVGAEALIWLVDATAAAVMAACLRNTRRSMVCLQGFKIGGQLTEVIVAQDARGGRSSVNGATAPDRSPKATGMGTPENPK